MQHLLVVDAQCNILLDMAQEVTQSTGEVCPWLASGHHIAAFICALTLGVNQSS